jgi:hypothetical protein
MVSMLSFFTHKFFKILLALYIGAFLLIWLISSPLIKHFIAPVLAEKQLHLSDDSSIRFNPFLMRFTLNDINLFSSKKKPKETVFSLLHMEVQVALWQLALNKIVLSNFLLDQGTLKITQHDDQLIIAGIEIPSSTKETVDGSASSFPYQLILPDLLLSQFTISIERDTQKQKNQTHHIAIEQLTLSQVKATKDKQQANLALIALIDKAHLAFTANTLLISGKGDINSNIRLKNYPIEKLVPYVKQLTELKGSLSFNSQQTITLAEQGLNVRVQSAGINLQDLLVGFEQQYLTLNNFQVNVTELALDLQNNAITHLAGQSSIKLTDAEFNNSESKAKIATFKQLGVDDIHFVLDEEPSIDITKVVFDEFLFSKKPTLTDALAQKFIDKINVRSAEDGVDITAEDIVKLPPVMQFKQLTVSNLHIHEKSIAINSIIFDTLTGEIIVNENKNIANLVKLGDESAQQSIVEPNSSKTKANSSDFAFSFNKLRFINKNTFDFTDFSVDPIYERTLFLDTLDIGALSNRKEKQQDKTPFILAGRSNKYANFNLTGYLQPFSVLAAYHVKGDFKEFSLPAISPYLKASTGVEVKTGQLNTALDVTLIGDQLKGNVVVLLQALETALVDEEEAGNLIAQGALPLNMAIGMLKDSDGNVELDVPLSGSTSDPKFGLSSIVTLITKKAIMSATQDYLMTTFVPYANIVSIAITAGEFALKLRFDDLEYQVKQIEPDNQQSAYLNDFIALMKDKEDTRVTICAISIPADIGLKSGTSVTEKSDIKRLIELGEKREHAFKDHLIEQGEINSSRILFCKPQIDSDKGAIPRIVISV